MNMEELVESFIKLREKKSQLKAAYDAKVAGIEQLQNQIEGLLLAKFNELGIDSVKTPAGTAYSQVRSSVSVADKDVFKQFIVEHDLLDMLELRPSKSAIEQYKAANEDLPPGLNWSEIRVVNFRRS